MAFATRISWEKHLLNLAMAFSPLNPSEPTSKCFMRNTNKRLRRLLLQDRGTAKEKQMRKGNQPSLTIRNSDYIAEDKNNTPPSTVTQR